VSLEFALRLLPGLVIGLTLHEFAHAFSASLLGDDFPRRQGRLSLNPLRHLSLLGTLAIFLLPFGWAKPVRVNLYNFRRPRRDYFLSSLAGPAANLLVIAACFLLMQITRRSFLFGPGAEVPMGLAHWFLDWVALINVILATLNLLPIPPLDGSKIWPVLIPGLKPDFGGKWSRLFIILLVVLLWTGAISPIFGFAVRTLDRATPATDSERFDRHVRAGDRAFHAKDYDRAAAHYTAALSINRWSAEVLMDRAYAHWYRRDWQAALANLNAAFALRPARAEDLLLRADVFEKLGQPDQAARDIEAAARLRGATRPAARTAPASTTAPSR
jgi:Zn-dependent protease